MPTIGQRVREAREHRGLSQIALAEMIGMTQATISNIETGYADPSIKTLVKLSKALDLSSDELLSGLVIDSTPA